MEGASSNKSLIFAILFATVVIAGSLIFLALQFTSTSAQPSEDQIVNKVVEKLIAEIQGKEPEAKKTVPFINDTDHVRGNPSAPISLIEYSDFECPFCKQFHTTAKQIINTYSQVNWVYRHFPISRHEPNASLQAAAAECAGSLGNNEKFWMMADLIFQNTQGNKTGPNQQQLMGFADQMEMNTSEFESCLSDPEIRQKIKVQLQEGVDVGVNGTPGNFLINNNTKEVIKMRGAESFDDMKVRIDAILGS